MVEFLKTNCYNIVRNGKDTFIVLFIRKERQKSVLLKRQNRIKIGEGETLVWGKNEYVLTHTWFSGGDIQYILIFPG